VCIGLPSSLPVPLSLLPPLLPFPSLPLSLSLQPLSNSHSTHTTTTPWTGAPLVRLTVRILCSMWSSTSMPWSHTCNGSSRRREGQSQHSRLPQQSRPRQPMPCHTHDKDIMLHTPCHPPSPTARSICPPRLPPSPHCPWPLMPRCPAPVYPRPPPSLP
jgi:hypothetical protein